MSLVPFHPFSMEYTSDPRPYFDRFHAQAPLHHHEEFGAWFAHDYETVRAFCDHPQTTRRLGQIPSFEAGAAERLARWPITEASMTGVGAEETTEAEDRLVLRKLLAPDFRPRSIKKMTATVQDVVSKQCAPLQSASDLDIVELVQGVPLSIISRLLGISESSKNAEIFLKSAPDFFRGMTLLAEDSVRDRAEIAAMQMFQVLGEEVADRRAHPRDDMISQIIEIADADGVDPEQIVQSLVVLVAAGTDTTRLTSSLAVKTLLDHPEEFERLRENRDLLPNAIMEFLRYESPTKFLSRTAQTDIEWKGQTLPAGSILLISIFGAGWDPTVFERPEVFDLERDLRGSLSFGFGAGYCLGVHLARLQVGELVNFFLDHLPVDATYDASKMTWDPRNILLREITSMPVHLR